MMSVITLWLAGLGWADDDNIDPAHSGVSFKLEQLRISRATERFEELSGRFRFDPNNVQQAAVNAKMAAASIGPGVKKRDQHLRSVDFLEVEEYPEISFVSKEMEMTSG